MARPGRQRNQNVCTVLTPITLIGEPGVWHGVGRPLGSMGLCRGDIGHVTDTLSHSTVGS